LCCLNLIPGELVITNHILGSTDRAYWLDGHD
jgi:hypothetical protein